MSSKCTKLHTVTASNNRNHAMVTLSLLVHAIYIWVLFFMHMPFLVNRTFNTMTTERLQQHRTSFSQQIALILCFSLILRLHLARPSHPGHSTIFCNREPQAANVQSFPPWQQATIEITCHDHSIIACSHHIYISVVLHTHPVCGGSHIQRNNNQEDATIEMVT